MMSVIKNDDRDYIAGICHDNYDGEGMFIESGWTAIAEGIADELIPGESLYQYLGRYVPGDAGEVTPELLEALELVNSCRLTVTATVAPEVLAAATRAQAERWTQKELVAAVKEIAARYQPRFSRLADLVGTRR
jgi:hypothetical protein